MWEFVDKCLLCDSINTQPWGRQEYPGYITVKCNQCGLIYVEKRLNAEERQKLIDNYETERQDPDKAEKREQAYDLDLKFLTRYKKLMPSVGAMLDVGCGNGRFAQKFTRQFPGWDAWGIEPGHAAYQEAVKFFGQTRCKNDYLENVWLPDSYFNIIILRGVLEHIPWPQQFAQLLDKYARNDAWIFVSATPNADSFCCQHYKQNWKLFYPNHHIIVWNVGTISQLLEPYDFEFFADSYPYLETAYANPLEDIMDVGQDIEFNDFVESPPFFGSMLTGLWRRCI